MLIFFLKKLFLNYNLYLIIFTPTILLADYFKWEILFAKNGFGTEIQIIPLSEKGDIKLSAQEIECRVEKFWTSINSELLIEGKTLICIKGQNEHKVSLVCSDNNLIRKYNNIKEIYPFNKNGFLIDPSLGSNSAYLELRCYF